MRTRTVALAAVVLTLVVACSTTNDDVVSTYAPKFSDRAHALAALKPLVANATDRVPCGLSQPDAALRSLRDATRLELHTTLARLAVGEFTSS